MSASANPDRRGGSVTLGGGLASLAAIAAAVATPSWVLGLGIGAIAIVVLAQTLLPQESAHRLAWWQARWNRCTHHQDQPSQTELPGRRPSPQRRRRRRSRR